MSAAGTAAAPSLTPVSQHNHLLTIGGYFSLAFAVFQLSGIWWPPSAIKYLGGPAQLSVERPVVYASLCVIVAAGVAVFGAYALSGAGKIRALPLLRTVLIAVTVIYVLRGLLLIPEAPFVLRNPQYLRFLIFSCISLLVGLVHLGGVVQLYRHGRPGEARRAAAN